MNSISKISPIWSTMPQKAQPAEVKEEAPALSFTDIFRSAIQEANQAQQEVAKNDYLLATGQLENPASSSIAIAKAELSVQMLSQLRTKALDAYNEIMRISM